MSLSAMAMTVNSFAREIKSQGKAASRLEKMRKQLVKLNGPVTRGDTNQAEFLKDMPRLDKFTTQHLAGPSHDSTYDRLISHFPELKGWLPLVAATNRLDRSYAVHPESGSWPSIRKILWQHTFEASILPRLKALKKSGGNEMPVGAVMKALLTPPDSQLDRSRFLEIMRIQTDWAFEGAGIEDAKGKPYTETEKSLTKLSEKLGGMIKDLESNPSKVAEFIDKKLAGYDELRQLSLAHLYAAEQLKKKGCTGWPAKYDGLGAHYAKIGKQFMKLAGLVYNHKNWMAMEQMQDEATKILKSMKPGKKDVRFLQVSLLRRGLDDRTTLRFDSGRTAIGANGKNYPMAGAITYVGKGENADFYSWVANGSRNFMGLALRLALFNATTCSVDPKGNGGGEEDDIPPQIRCPKGTIKNRWAKKPKCVPPNCKNGRKKNGTCKTGSVMKPDVWD
jgi:hypothetical protein